MKKKIYIKPEIEVMSITPFQILAVSGENDEEDSGMTLTNKNTIWNDDNQFSKQSTDNSIWE